MNNRFSELFIRRPVATPLERRFGRIAGVTEITSSSSLAAILPCATTILISGTMLFNWSRTSARSLMRGAT